MYGSLLSRGSPRDGRGPRQPVPGSRGTIQSHSTNSAGKSRKGVVLYTYVASCMQGVVAPRAVDHPIAYACEPRHTVDHEYT